MAADRAGSAADLDDLGSFREVDARQVCLTDLALLGVRRPNLEDR
jgi:hypothetical protein